MASALDRLKERAQQSYAKVMAAANGRELDVEYPHWKRPNGTTEQLTRQERDLVLRWQFLASGVASINAAGAEATAANNDKFAEAYLRTDEEIGPVHIRIGPLDTRVVFGDASERSLSKSEQAAVDRLLDAHDDYRAKLSPPQQN